MGQSDESEAPVRPLRAADAALADLWVASSQVAMPAIDLAARRGWILGFLARPAYATLVAVEDVGRMGKDVASGRIP